MRPGTTLAVLAAGAALLVSCSSGSRPAGQRPTTTVAPQGASRATSTAAPSRGAQTTIPIPPAPTAVFSVSFVSPTRGWVIGQRPCGPAPESCLYIYETLDRGQHWREVGAPAAAGPSELGATSEYVTEMRFANTSDGYAFNRALWVTRDGGVTWAEDRLPTNPWAIDVEAADGLAYLLTAPCGDGIGNCEGPDTVYAAPAGSSNWRPIGHFSVGLQAAQLVVAGRDVYAMVGGPDGGLLAGTAAGLSPRPLPSGCSFPAGLAAWAQGGLVLVCGLSGSGSGSGQVAGTALFTSDDGGRHWTRAPVLPPGTVYEGVAAPAPGVVFLAVPGGGTQGAGLWMSSDGGSRWTTVPDAPPSPSYVGFETPSDGVVIATNGLYLTDDGGATWAMARGAGPATCSQEAVQGGIFAVCPGSGPVGTRVTVSSDTNCGVPGDGEPSLEFLGPEAYIGSGGGGENVAISRAGVGFTASFVIPSAYYGGEQTGHGMQTLAVSPGDGYSFATYPAGECRAPFTVTG
jgi:photosystem II stability/assembly factor-like uncharacterized protein